jgi:hypothetical protein
MTEQVATYTLRIMGEAVYEEDAKEVTAESLGDLMSDVENQVSSQLPEGMYCKVDSA